MTQYTKSEDGGRFILTSAPSGAYSQDTGDIGRGSEQQIAAFTTEQERAYYLQARIYEEVATHALRELTGLRRSLVNSVMPSGRLRKARILELIETAKRELEPRI